MSDDMRVLTRVDHTNRRVDFAAFGLTAVARSGKTYECTIDQKTGLIGGIPEFASWHRCRSAETAKNSPSPIVHFDVSLFTYPDQPIVVVQRQGRTNRYRKAMFSHIGDVVQHTMPPCKVNYHWSDDVGLSVWTAPMNKEHSNRFDLWAVDPDGEIELRCVYLHTLNNGEPFSLNDQVRWSGHVYRRKPGTAFVLPDYDDDKRQLELYNRSAEVRDMLNRYVFVPGEHSEHFASRMQILENAEFRTLINAAALEEWDGPENFWTVRKPSVHLKGNQAYVKFLTYGVGKGSFGILLLETPIVWKSRTIDSIQFDHQAVQGELLDDDQQGIYFLAPGTIVEFGELDDMDKDGHQFPPKAKRVVPQNVPVPIDPATLEVVDA